MKRSGRVLAAICLACATLAHGGAVARAQAVSGGVSSPAVISTVAGNAALKVNYGFTGDGGLATSAEINNPNGIAFDAAGNLYIADSSNNVVRKVAAGTGIVTTVAGKYAVDSSGNPLGGYSGDGGLATSATLNFPGGVALDAAGNLYIADLYNNLIRKVAAATGIITTVAGTARAGTLTTVSYSGDGGLATAARIYQPFAVAVDAVGDLYIADTGNNVIRKVTASTGFISTVAGHYVATNNNPTGGYSGDGGMATSALLKSPSEIALDSAGNIFIADYSNNAVRKVTVSTGYISTVAGSQAKGGGYSGDGGAATSAQLSLPSAVAFDKFGNLYIADSNNSVIREVAAGTGNITTVAGNFAAGNGFNGDGIVATSAQIYNPFGVAVDGANNLYISDGNNLIRKVASGAALPETAVGASAVLQKVPVALTAATAVSGFTISSAQNGAAEFNLAPTTGCTVGTTSNAAGTVCMVPVAFTPQYPGVRTGTLSVMNGSTVVGTVGLSGLGDAPLGALTAASSLSTVSGTSGLGNPNGIAVDAHGNLFVGDSANNRVVKITPAGVQTTIESGLTFPYAVAVDGAGNVALVGGVPGVGTSGSGYGTGGTVVAETPEGTQTTVGAVAGAPGGIAFDMAGNLYISDAAKNIVLKVNAAQEQITLPTTGLSSPGALAVDAAGNVYIADVRNSRVVELTPGGVQTTIAATGLGAPTGVGVDAAGDVYILDHTNKTVVVVSPAGVQTTLPFTGLNNPSGLAVDGAGNVYVVNGNSNNVLQLSAGGTALMYAATTTGTSSPEQVVSLENIGNQPLAISALAASANFNLNGSGTTCLTTTTLAAGASCGLGVELQPTAPGILTGTATVTDNSQNAIAPHNVQAISLSGVAIAATQTTLMVSPASVFAGATVTLTATVTASGGDMPMGTVTFASGSLMLGTAAVNASGVASVTTTLLPVGSDTVTASFAGATGYTASTSTNTIVVGAASFNFAAGGTSSTISVAQGAAATTTFTVSPQGSYTGSLAFSCTGLPKYATCTFSPATLALTASSPATTVTLTLNTNVQTAQLETLPVSRPAGPANPLGPMAPALAGGLVGLAMLKRRRLGRLLGLVILAGALAAGLSGCGGSAATVATTAATVTPTGSSTVSVVATGTAGGVVTTQTVPLTITITP